MIHKGQKGKTDHLQNGKTISCTTARLSCNFNLEQIHLTDKIQSDSLNNLKDLNKDQFYIQKRKRVQRNKLLKLNNNAAPIDFPCCITKREMAQEVLRLTNTKTEMKDSV